MLASGGGGGGIKKKRIFFRAEFKKHSTQFYTTAEQSEGKKRTCRDNSSAKIRNIFSHRAKVHFRKSSLACPLGEITTHLLKFSQNMVLSVCLR